jgi:4-amino-4-deoxy-L-arabinose transferase-like glycosyltransferase
MTPYYLLLRVWAGFGFSEFHLRFLSVMAGVLSLIGIYLLGKELYGRSAGLLTSLLLALHSFHVHYSQEARSYALLSLTLILAAYFIVCASRSSSTTNWIPAVLFSAVSVYLHFLSGLVVLALFCSVPFRAARAIGARGCVRVLGLLGILLVPAIVYVLDHRDIVAMGWIPSPSWPLLARCGATLLGTGGTLALIYTTACLLPLAAPRAAPSQPDLNEPSASVILPAMWAFLPGVFLLAVSFFRPILLERYL